MVIMVMIMHIKPAGGLGISGRIYENLCVLFCFYLVLVYPPPVWVSTMGSGVPDFLWYMHSR